MLKINLYKIIFILKKEKGMTNTRDLARLTKIHYKNIGRYLNVLEVNGLVDREIYQDKKRRYILNSLTLNGLRFIIPQDYRQFLEKILRVVSN